MTVFIRALDPEDKAAALKGHLQDSCRRFDVDPDEFSNLPKSPFAYWISTSLRRVFVEIPSLEGNGRTAAVGLQTSDDFRFVRSWWALRPSGRPGCWCPFAKGGKFSPYYSDLALTVRCVDNFKENVAFTNARYPYLKGNARSLLHADMGNFLKPGLTWPIKNRFSFKPWPLPRNCVFAHIGPTVFLDDSSGRALSALQGLMSSEVFTALVRVMAGWNFEVGVIQRTPVPRLTPEDERTLAALAHRSWSLKRNLDTRTETSHAFTRPALLQVEGKSLSLRTTAWNDHVAATNSELDEIQAEIDDRCFELYGIDDNDRRAITEGFGAGEVEEPERLGPEANQDDDQLEANADEATLAAELLSWAGGVAFGRFDVRLATGERELPEEPDPFDPLPICSAAMLTGEDGLPLDTAPEGYPLSFPEDGILVDDEGDARDLLAAVRGVFDEVFRSDADVWWSEVAAALSPKRHDLRPWLASSFFTHHLKHHSKSRRKAPIVWQLAVPSKRYSVFLYAHRLTADSLFQVQNDVVAPKLAHEERRLTSLIQEVAGNPSASQRKEIAAQETFVEELRAMLDEVDRVAPLWNPDFDDGVVLTMAPLWRAVPQHKAWQRELNGKWKELSGGKYDWAHLAMHLWPERVVPKCATDRSLAIAHDLEDVFWVEDEDGKWQQRDAPIKATEELIAERRSAAVAEAVGRLV